MENTTFTITTDDAMEMRRYLKATDMALVIWEFQMNAMREFKHREIPPTADDVMDHFNNLMAQHNVDIDDLVE